MSQVCILGHPIRLYNALIPLRHRRASGHHKGSSRWSGWRSWIQYVSFADIFPQRIFNAPTDEILLIHDKAVAIIDGSGVLADPTGINREELVRLAKARKPVCFFDKAKLSKDGYLVKL